jgi:hypothetical protein
MLTRAAHPLPSAELLGPTLVPQLLAAAPYTVLPSAAAALLMLLRACAACAELLAPVLSVLLVPPVALLAVGCLQQKLSACLKLPCPASRLKLLLSHKSYNVFVFWYNLFTACTLATAADLAAELTISIARAADSIGRVRHAKAGGPFCHEGQTEYAGDA